MITLFKWFAAALFTGLAWFITEYAIEYFRPYKKIKIYNRD